MKKNVIIVCLLHAVFMPSCIWEELESLNEEITSRSGCNVALIDGSDVSFVSFNKENPEELAQWMDGNKTIYAYDGKDAVLSVVDGIPELSYSQNDENSGDFKYFIGKTPEDIKFKDAFGFMDLILKNNVSNLHLVVKDLTIYNISREGTFVFTETPYWTDLNKNGKIHIENDSTCIIPGDSLVLGKEIPYPIIPQYLKPWKIYVHPENDEGCYVLMNCVIYHLSDTLKGFQQDKDILLWDGLAAIPIKALFKIGEKTTIRITLEEECKWMDIQSDTPSPILVPIIFDATLDDWEEGGDVDVEV